MDQKAAAAYGLCGVYRKTGNVQEQLRFALWLRTTTVSNQKYVAIPTLADMSVYWASFGWDLNMLLEAEAPIDALASFVEQNPDLPDIRIVKYSLAVRLARENRYREAADRYDTVRAVGRASRMRHLAVLYEAAYPSDGNGLGVSESQIPIGGIPQFQSRASLLQRQPLERPSAVCVLCLG